MNKINLELDHKTISLEKTVHGLIFLYIMTIPFQTLGFRFMGLVIGLPELLFLLLTPLAIIHLIISGQKLWIDKLDLFAFAWLIVNIISGWQRGFDSIIVAELIKRAYLVLLYMILKWIISLEMIARIVKVIIFSSLMAALTGIIGYLLGYLGIDTILSITRPFPYGMKIAVQAKGFSPTPNMLASIIMIGVLFHLQKLNMNQITTKSKDYFILSILLLGFILTFSKTVICLLIGIILVLYFNYKLILSNTWRLIAQTTIITLFIVYIFGTHFIIAEKHQNVDFLKGDYIAGPALIETTNYSIFPSQYWSLKKISIEAINQSIPWGLGPGKFNGFAHEFKKNDAYSTHVPYPDTHSTYLETLSENGLLGLIALLGIIYYVVKYSRKIFNNQSANKYFVACLPSIFIVIGIEAVSTDVMNFRHYWIVLILLVSTYQKLKSTFSKSLNL